VIFVDLLAREVFGLRLSGKAVDDGLHRLRIDHLDDAGAVVNMLPGCLNLVKAVFGQLAGSVQNACVHGFWVRFKRV